MAISAEYLKLSQSDRVTEPAQNTFLQHLVDAGAVYVPQVLSVPQFATLHALLNRLTPQPEDNPAHLTARLDAALASGSTAALAPRSRAYPLGLDELDTLARTRAGYPFAELTPELQDAMIDLIATGYLFTGKLNLALWLEDLRSITAPIPSATRHQ